MIASRFRPPAFTLIVGVLLVAWIVWLRAPSFRTTMWNVDESISAVVAERILDGHVMYRDIADHRTPLSYYAVAAVFAVTGVNMTALHVLVAVMIAGTAFGLFLLGRRTRDMGTGVCAAAIFAALSCYLLTPSDAYAAHTEWFLILFTTSAAVVFWRAPGTPSFARSTAVGALIGLAFLSKQPALVDLGAPLGTLLYLGVTRTAPWRILVRAGAGLLAGFAVVVGSVAAVFVMLGAWSDVAFYTWIYNTRYYGPETSWADRVLSPGPFFAQFATLYPYVFALGVLGALIVIVRVAQFRPTTEVGATRGWECYLLLWCGTSLAAAMASGRSFDHYFIQCLPPFAWMAAWVPGWLAARAKSASIGLPARVSAVVALLALAITVTFTPLAARHVSEPPLDPALRLSEFIRVHSAPDDKLFVWGYNPDIYLYAQRAPATRFVYCTFHTGLIPWTNLEPAKDTTYAIVPGAMDALLRDLARSQPAFIVDCGVGPHRRFSKYPLRNFARLREYVDAHYVEVDPSRYQAQGFRLFMRSDASRAGPLPQPAAPPAGTRGIPGVHGPSGAGAGQNFYTVDASLEEPQLRGLALYVDGHAVGAVHFPPAKSMLIQVPVSFDETGTLHHQLQAVSTLTDGQILLSGTLDVAVLKLNRSATVRRAFELPLISTGVRADAVRAFIEPRADYDTGERVFSVHAPSLLSYTLPANASVVRGRFGIPAGAYAPDNKAPTDGAEFIVRVIDAMGKSHVLHQRRLDPAREPGDRPTQSFRVELAKLPPPLQLELEITAGPAGVPSSDWTFWSDVVVETLP